MKKAIALLVSLIMLFVNCALPASAAVYDSEPEVQVNDLLVLACEVFPEYADRITTEYHSSNSRSARTLVREISRESDNGSIFTYTEYSDGLVLLTESEVDFKCEETQTDMEVEQSITRCTLSVRAFSNKFTYGYFQFNNIRFVLDRFNYDYITSYGSAIKYGSPLCLSPSTPTVIYNETASRRAQISYFIHWDTNDPISKDYWPTELRIVIGNTTYSVSHIDLM